MANRSIAALKTVDLRALDIPLVVYRQECKNIGMNVCTQCTVMRFIK